MVMFNTDAEYKAHLLTESRYSLSYDDQLLLDILCSDNVVSECLWCGSSSIKHSITSVCAGHGDYPRYVRIKCNNCAFSIKGCISYGDTYNDVRNAYVRKYNDLKEKFKND